MSNNELLEAALEYASWGWPVFPCRHDKTPHTKNGVLDATTDEQQIKDWWTKWPGANVAVNAGEAGLLVVDYDPGSSFEAAERSVGDLPNTKMRASTPRGGEHHYYELDPSDDPVASTKKTFTEHVDVRSFHGYVLMPPSSTKDGDYEWIEDGDPAYRSQDLLDACRRAGKKNKNRNDWIIEPDLPENIESARKWCRQELKIGGKYCDYAIQGQNGDNCTYATAAMMKSFGLSEGMALEVLWEEWNPDCDPSWPYEDLKLKIENGYTYNQNPPGNVTPAYHVAKVSNLFGPVERQEMGKGVELRSGKYRLVNRAGLEAIKPPEWLIPDCVPRDSYAMLVGESGAYKTFLSVDLALTVASGGERLMTRSGEWKGVWPAPTKPGPVLFMAGEGRSGIKKRVKAWEQTNWDSRQVPGFVLADPLPHVTDESIEGLVKIALEEHPEGYSLVVLDTVARAMSGVNENAMENATAFNSLVAELQRELGATVLAIHHTGHTHKDRARGSSAFYADLDTEFIVTKQGDKRLRLHMSKQREWKPWQQDKWIVLNDVNLPGEDEESLIPRIGEAPAGGMSKDDVERFTHDMIAEGALQILRREGEHQEITLNALADKMIAVGYKVDPEQDDVDSYPSKSTITKRLKDLRAVTHKDHPLYIMFDESKGSSGKYRYSEMADVDGERIVANDK